jgi:hypothetical protein
MGIPTTPTTLTSEQVQELNAKLSTMRHDINNHLSLMVAALELIRYKPEMRERMIATLAEQPGKIMAEVMRFSGDFEKSFGITREDKKPG